MMLDVARKLQKGARLLRSRFLGGALILGYHRVADYPSDPYLLRVTPRNFAEQLDVIRKQRQPISLKALVEALRDGNLPRRAVIVTFDDGYADNVYNAKPLLDDYQIPATVFVTTGRVGSDREFWWDELERILLHQMTLPKRLDLRIDEQSYHWDLGNAAHYLSEDLLYDPDWNFLQKVFPTQRHYLLHSLYQLLRSMSEEQRQKVMEQLRAWAGSESIGRPTHRALSAEELICLAKGGLVEVGSHTVTHPALAEVPLAVQRSEIHRSKAWLENLLGEPITSFSYPNGSHSAQTVNMLREAGFLCACSSSADVVRRGDDLFQLPRLWVQDFTGPRFSRWLKKWLPD